jgi:TM2 domain-containing membrane protein YozV
MDDPQQAPISLKDPAVAALLAWLIPGLGHLYQGRYAKAMLFFVFILGTFVFGLYLGSSNELGWGRVVYASWRDDDQRLAYLCQIGVGLPAMPALIQANRVRNQKEPWLHGFMAPPQLDGANPAGLAKEPTVSKLHYELHRFFELGTVYTMIAGLLNVLAIYDAWEGPVLGETRKEESDDDDEEASAKNKDGKS